MPRLFGGITSNLELNKVWGYPYTFNLLLKWILRSLT